MLIKRIKKFNFQTILLNLILAPFKLIIKLPVSISLGFGRALGVIVFLLSPRLRRITQINIHKCFPQLSKLEQKKLVLTSFKSIGMGIIETNISWYYKKQHLPKITQFEGLEHLTQALEDGQGAIILGIHQVSAELAGRIFNNMIPLNAIYQRINNKHINKVILKKREKIYHNLIPNSDIRQMLRVLKNNEVIWFAPDQAPKKKHTVFVPFFNMITASSTSTSKLAALSGAKVFPSSCWRISDTEFGAKIYPALTDFPSNDLAKDAIQINNVFEEVITKNPEQYLWQYKRFKITKDGSTHIYDKK